MKKIEIDVLFGFLKKTYDYILREDTPEIALDPFLREGFSKQWSEIEATYKESNKKKIILWEPSQRHTPSRVQQRVRLCLAI